MLLLCFKHLGQSYNN